VPSFAYLGEPTKARTRNKRTAAIGRKQTAAIGHKETTAALADEQSFLQTTIPFRI
jgi:hypothetical protein